MEIMFCKEAYDECCLFLEDFVLKVELDYYCKIVINSSLLYDLDL